METAVAFVLLESAAGLDWQNEVNVSMCNWAELRGEGDRILSMPWETFQNLRMAIQQTLSATQFTLTEDPYGGKCRVSGAIASFDVDGWLIRWPGDSPMDNTRRHKATACLLFQHKMTACVLANSRQGNVEGLVYTLNLG